MEKNNLLSKLYQVANYKVDAILAKAKDYGTVRKYSMKHKSIYVDEMATLDYGGYQEKPSLVPFDILRMIAERDMIALAVINKIVNRAAAFSRPQKDKYSMGYVIRKRKEDDTNSDEEKAEIEEIQEFINSTGYLSDDRPNIHVKNFDTFLRLIVRDALIYNQIAIECILTAEGKLSYFVPVSGGSIRFAIKDLAKRYKDLNALVFALPTDEERKELIDDMQSKLDDIKYFQIYKGQIYAAYTEEELIYRQRVPTVEISTQGYSPGELEWLINTVAAHRISESYNEVFFKQGFGGGILNIKTEMTEEELDAVKRMFQRTGQGFRNAHRQMIFTVPEGMEWINMGHVSNKDMEWYEWMCYLIKLICAVYGMDPSEINFDITRGNSAPTLSDSGNRNETILKETHNSVLRPLLRWLEALINEDILPRMDPEIAKKYVFEFAGLDSEGVDKELERIKLRVENYETLNEVRTEQQLDPIEFGDIVLNAQYLQYRIQKEQQDINSSGNNFDSGIGDDPNKDEFDGGIGENEEAVEGSEDVITDSELDSMLSSNVSEAQKSLKKSVNKLIKKPMKIEWYK